MVHLEAGEMVEQDDLILELEPVKEEVVKQ
jgi:hypothetical protein